MTDLASRNCVPCRGGDPPLSKEKIHEYLQELPDWALHELEGVQRITRAFNFPDFNAALDFTNRVGEIAEKVDHHPQLVTAWGRVTVSWWTYIIPGLHMNDFVLAARTDQLYEAWLRENPSWGGDTPH